MTLRGLGSREPASTTASARLHSERRSGNDARRRIDAPAASDFLSLAPVTDRSAVAAGMRRIVV